MPQESETERLRGIVERARLANALALATAYASGAVDPEPERRHAGE